MESEITVIDHEVIDHELIYEQDLPERFIPQASPWTVSSSVRETPITRIAERGLHYTANDYYFDPDERSGIEDWMAGGNAALQFADICHVIGIFELDSARRYIREYKPAKGGRKSRKNIGEAPALMMNPSKSHSPQERAKAAVENLSSESLLLLDCTKSL